MEEVIWKDIPNYSNYQVSNTALVRCRDKKGGWALCKLYEGATSVGTYIVCHAFDDAGNYRPKGVHQFVCYAFNGPPPEDGKRYEVNHIDANKHNNLPSNLEWMTRSENTLHALKSGIRNDNLQIEVKDHLTGQVDLYYALSELSRVWGIPRNSLREIISRHETALYLERWTFKIIRERLGKINRPHHNSVICKDYVANEIIVANDCAEMEYYTKIKSSTILIRVGKGNSKIKNPYSLIGGYVFKELTDKQPWPEYTKQQAIQSREAYLKNKLKTYTVTDHIKDTVTEHKTLKSASAEIGINSLSLKYRINRGMFSSIKNRFSLTVKDGK